MKREKNKKNKKTHVFTSRSWPTDLRDDRSIFFARRLLRWCNHWVIIIVASNRVAAAAASSDVWKQNQQKKTTTTQHSCLLSVRVDKQKVPLSLSLLWTFAAVDSYQCPPVWRFSQRENWALGPFIHIFFVLCEINNISRRRRRRRDAVALFCSVRDFVVVVVSWLWLCSW